ncbi:Smr/MutS family protein [Halosquirtibacter laminarini]|uniref:Smr/MutS family protein n=1 Tax=Halosquirtibacter laminarini TaxID=3374600 RepID=A0AC61NCE1_9BACT|nr:Smr/MutS family protein [Prolixibacteraceae bacterium]
MYNIYPSNFEQKIGFDQIRIMLEKRCLSHLGRELCREFGFMKVHKTIKTALFETNEFLSILQGDREFPSINFGDIRPALHKAKIEGTFVDESELFELKKSLESVRGVVNFFKNSEPEDFKSLKDVIKEIEIFPFIYQRIDDILTKHGKIKDHASAELSRIRREIIIRQSSVSKTMNSILRRMQKDGYVDSDVSVSMRDGRAVIPISASHKRKIKGIVHDESATGKTAYIEPSEIVETNNAIRELEYAERREVIRILTEFTDSIRPYVDSLLNSHTILGTIDFIRAKAVFAKDTECVLPRLKQYPIMKWHKARHLVLESNLRKEGRKIVPLDICLDRKGRILLISGPNAGGKSVCLKSAGLIQYMIQTGMLAPMDSESHIGVFDGIFVDIGDEQSIDNDLSTYSSHLTNMKYFLRNTTENSLILIDEFGSGTEPMLGGAIAESVLNTLNKQKVYGVITTHYTNLKHFASSCDGIENGAMLYDSHKMEPLFQLAIGRPGSSFAFEIARKIGLPESILQEATDKLGKDHIDFDKHLREVLRDKRYWENKRTDIRKLEKQLEEMSSKYQHDIKEANKQRKDIIERAKQEADILLKSSNKIIEKTVREIRESQADKEKTRELRKNLSEFKEDVATNTTIHDEKIHRKMKKLQEKESLIKKKVSKQGGQSISSTVRKEEEGISKIKDHKLEIGCGVRIKGQSNVGEVLEIEGNQVIVAFGMLRSVLKLNKIEVVSASTAKKITKNKTLGIINDKISEEKLTFKAEIDIRGERAEDALRKVQQFVDKAITLGEKELRILHGKGSGILRELIRKQLQAEPMVRNVKDAPVQFGGSGISIVTLN